MRQKTKQPRINKVIFSLNDKELRDLKRLAKQQSSGNCSALIRSLITKALR